MDNENKNMKTGDGSNWCATAQKWKQPTPYKGNLQIGKNIYKHTSDKLLLYKICKKLIQMYNKKMNNPVKTMAKNAKWDFLK